MDRAPWWSSATTSAPTIQTCSARSSRRRATFAEPQKRTADKDGTFGHPPVKGGLCGVRARHVEAKQGELDGKKYKEIRHYSTLVIQVADGATAKSSGPAKADPQATKLLADARTARA